MSTLQKIYSKYSHPGGWGDKGTAHNYIPTYEKHMTRTDGITLVEVGVMRGHSIKMWNEYFTNSKIVGLDISLKNLEFELDNVYECDGTDPRALDRCLPGWTFDYAIDDGSHFVKDQLSFIDVFLPRMNSNGVLFIEDIAGDGALAAIESRLSSSNYLVVDGRQEGRPEDEIMVVVFT